MSATGVAERLAADRRRRGRAWAGFAIAAVALVATQVVLSVSGVGGFPENWSIGLADWIDSARRWVIDNQNTHWVFSWIFNPISDTIDWGLLRVEGVLLWLPWPVVVAGAAMLATSLIGLRGGLLTAVGVLYFGAVELWEPSMQTVALMVVAVAIAVAIGVPLGIAAARYRRLEQALRPMLDAMQTLPAFVYLIPVVLLFGVARVPAIIASVVYALPPVVRLTTLGIKSVPRETVEAAEMFGATPRQTLRQVQFPLALPTVLTGVNQTIMMALSIVVIAALIGAGGLGQEVLESLRRLFVGRALEAGMAIVVIAIILDRLTSAAATRSSPGRKRRRLRLFPDSTAGVPPVRAAEKVLAAADRAMQATGRAPARLAGTVLTAAGRVGPTLWRRVAGVAGVVAVIAVVIGDGLLFWCGAGVSIVAVSALARAPAATAAVARHPRRALAVLLLAAGTAAGVWRDWREFPESPAFSWVSFAEPVDRLVDWVRDNLYQLGNSPFGTGPFSDFITIYAVKPLRELFSSGLVWPVVLTAAVLAGWHLGGKALAVFCAFCVLGLGVLGVWELSMDTFAQTIVAVVLSLLAGIPLGVAASFSDRFERMLKPVLDFLQTIPSFVLLVPVIILFNVGRVPGIIASVLYALPAATRLTNLGIRQVAGEATEASKSFGATRSQTLRKVQVPLAMPSIIAGINQTVMLVLAMVVIAGLVGGGGLGLETVKGLRRSDSVGSGFVAGLAIVLLAMLLDRLLGAWTRRHTPQASQH